MRAPKMPGDFLTNRGNDAATKFLVILGLLFIAPGALALLLWVFK